MIIHEYIQVRYLSHRNNYMHAWDDVMFNVIPTEVIKILWWHCMICLRLVVCSIPPASLVGRRCHVTCVHARVAVKQRIHTFLPLGVRQLSLKQVGYGDL